MPKDELRGYTTGAAVTALTVTKGTPPERFTGTYIGFIEGALGKGKDMLLFKLSSPIIVGTAGLKPAGVTVNWIEHIAHALLKVVDVLMCLAFGKILAIGDPQEVMRSPEVIEVYLGSTFDAAS